MSDEEHLLLALDDTAATGVRVAGLRIVNHAVAFAASILIARTLGPQGRGLVALPIAFLGIVVALSNLGIQQASVFFASRGTALRRLWAVAGTAAIGAALAAWVVVAGLRSIIGATFLGGLPVSWIAVVLAQLPLLLATLHWTGVLQLDGALRQLTHVTLVAGVAFAGAALVLVATDSLTPFRTLALTWITAVLPFVLLIRLGIRRAVAALSVDRDLLKRAVAFGVRAQFATLFLFLLLRVDQVLVERELGFRELGLYALAVVLAEFLWLVTDPFAASLLPHQVRAAEGDERRLGYATARMGLVVAGSLCVAAYLVAPYVIRLAYGEAFTDSTWAFRWLLPGVVAIAAQRPLYAVVTKEGRMGLAATMNASALVLNVVLNLLLLPSHGIVGAAVASTVTYLALGIGYVLATRSDGVSGWRDLVPRMDDLARLGHAVRGIGALHPSRSPVGKDAHPPARSPALEDPPPPAPVRGCPLCGATDSRPVLSVPYATIWRELRARWGAIFPPDVMARHAPGSDACLVRCDDCGLEYFEGAVPGDGEFYERLMAGIPYHGARWEFEIVLARLGSDAAVVDLGCGGGAFVRLAARKARRAVGVDHNADAIASLIRSGSEGSALSFEAFAEAHPSAFDVACSFHTLEHLSDVGTVMRAARQLLRARGCLFVSVPNRARSGRGDEEPLDCPPHHISRWSEDQFEELAGRFDLRLLALHLEEPDLSHARAAALSRHRGSFQRRSGEPGILERLALRAAVSRRRHARAIANGDYRRRGIVGHSMLAEFDVPSE